MKNLKFLLCLLIVVAASMLVFSACGTTEDTTQEPASTTTVTTTVATTTYIDYVERSVTPAEAIAEDELKVYGRYVELDGGAISCDFTACGIEFSAWCRGDVAVDIQVSQPITGQGSVIGFYSIWVDGERIDTEVRKDSGKDTGYVSGTRVVKTQTVTLATGLEEGLHTFKILKQNNPRNCISQINNIKFEGQLAPRPADKEILIEFIGDSLTAAYGNLGSSKSTDNGSANIEDGTLSYAYLAAEKLDVDCSIIARPGIGMAFGTDSAANVQMADIYDLQCFWRSNSTKYETKRVPDLVVIYLGTNDNSNGSSKGGASWLTTFDTKFRGLVDGLLERYGEDTPILLLENRDISNTGVGNKMKAIDTDYENVKLIPFTRHKSGAGSHASAAECEIEANDLVAQLKTLYPDLFK